MNCQASNIFYTNDALINKLIQYNTNIKCQFRASVGFFVDTQISIEHELNIDSDNIPVYGNVYENILGTLRLFSLMLAVEM